MNKQWESERSRIEHADDARITFTIALHGKHAWEMLLEDSDRYHSISHGWATDNPHDWEDTIVPVLRRLFVNGRLGFAAKVPMYVSPNGSSANTNVPMYDPPLCNPATRAETNLNADRHHDNGGQNRIKPYPFLSEANVLTQVLSPKAA